MPLCIDNFTICIRVLRRGDSAKAIKNQETGIMAESKYDESFSERAMNFASDGLTDCQIAHKMGISRSSLKSVCRDCGILPRYPNCPE